MRDKLLHVVWVHGIQNIVEVGSVRQTRTRLRIRHVSHEFRIMYECLINVLDSKFIIQRHVDVLDLVECKQVLISSKNLLEEIFVDIYLRRHVELEVVLEESHKVLLGAELASQLRSHDSSFACATFKAHVCF